MIVVVAWVLAGKMSFDFEREFLMPMLDFRQYHLIRLRSGIFGEKGRGCWRDQGYLLMVENVEKVWESWRGKQWQLMVDRV